MACDVDASVSVNHMGRIEDPHKRDKGRRKEAPSASIQPPRKLREPQRSQMDTDREKNFYRRERRKRSGEA